MDEQTERPAPAVAAPEGSWPARREAPASRADAPPPGSEARAYVPPVDLVLLGLGIGAGDLTAPSVSVAAGFLRFLLGELARGAPFDARWYAAQYPDLERDRSADGPERLHEHFVTQGYFEGRLPHEPALDADWYFRYYRDVSATYRQWLEAALRAHFLTRGYGEGRVGTPQQAELANRWIDAARRLGPPARPRMPPAPPPQPAAPEPAARNPAPFAHQMLLRDFESLGWSGEFGLVQRHFNVEPVSLLTFATIPFHQLCLALSTRFDTLGRAGDTTIAVHQHEYCVVDAKHEFTKPTGIYQGATDPDELLNRECRKLNFLKAKLLRELLTASKIFVYQASPGLTEAEISELYCELLAYGDNMMLWVDAAEGGHRAGDIELLFGRLYKGYVDTFSPAPSAASGIAHSAWLEVCAKAHRLWRPPPAPVARLDPSA